MINRKELQLQVKNKKEKRVCETEDLNGCQQYMAKYRGKGNTMQQGKMLMPAH